MRYKNIWVPIYKSRVYVTSDRGVYSTLARQKTGVYLDNNSFIGSYGMTASTGCTSVLWLPPEATIETIAHEVTHAALNIFKYKGVDVDTGNQEPTAYLIGWLFDQVFNAWAVLK